MFIVNEPQVAAASQKIEKLWGTEYVILNNEKYCCKILKVVPGYVCSIHAHKLKDETFTGLMGTLRLNIHDKKGALVSTEAIHPGRNFRVKPGQYHSFEAVNLCWIMETSTTHSDDDVTRLKESRPINGQE